MSLAKELRRSEQRQKARVRSRQREEYLTKKLARADPARVYASYMEADPKKAAALLEEWLFVKKRIPKERAKAIVERYDAAVARVKEADTKLWGAKLVYYNPELNPLGKVPQLNGERLQNVTLPLKQPTTYDTDPIIEQLQITLPDGEPPRFYKQVYNTTVS